MARPTKYKSEYAELAGKVSQLGATDIEIADIIGVDVRTLYRWKASNDEFCQALKKGKEAADDRVERSLYHKAVGYTFEAVKIFQHQGKTINAPYREHVPPDTTAAIFWLKNRKPGEWRDKQDVEHSGDLNVSFTPADQGVL